MTTYLIYKKMVAERTELTSESTFYIMILCVLTAGLIDLLALLIAVVLIINI